jgi:hypothetical protein
MDGYEATRRLRHEEAATGAGVPTRPKPVPIVALSANALEEDRELGLQAGMNDYLTKPLRLPDLERVLREAAVASRGDRTGDGTGGDPARRGGYVLTRLRSRRRGAGRSGGARSEQFLERRPPHRRLEGASRSGTPLHCGRKPTP